MHVLLPGICEYITLHSERDFADVIKDLQTGSRNREIKDLETDLETGSRNREIILDYLGRLKVII